MQKHPLPFLCAQARLFLRIALPLVLVASVTFLISYLQSRAHDPVVANRLYPVLLEYLIAGVVITEAGAVLIDYIVRWDGGE